ncbi:MAG: carbon-nitrogen hydrolase [Euryarchaeota archaeon]|nr:carbon-nitrogen hydrolase [Euryarchaeota archaeon]
MHKPRPTSVTIGLVQAKAGTDPVKNMERSMQAVRDAARRGAEIICLQELYRSLYFPQTHDPSFFDLAETIPGPSTEAFSRLAAELGVVLIVPLFEKRAPGLYHNSAVAIDADGKMLGTYRKMHIPDDPGFQEKYYFAPGDAGYRAFDTRFGRIGILICWDQWYPEAARLTALQGAEVLFYPTAIGHSEADRSVADTQREAWETIQRSHAIANGVFVAAANRVGQEGSTTFWGASFVAGPLGQVIARASGDKEETIVARCDLADIQRTRHGWPFLRDRRIDSYSRISSRYGDE